MMKQLLEKIDEAVANEKSLADKDHGPMHSRHEGYGVVAEEVMELGADYKDVSFLFGGLLLHIDNGIWINKVERLARSARLAAAEAVQVAAVCERILEIEKDGVSA